MSRKNRKIYEKFYDLTSASKKKPFLADLSIHEYFFYVCMCKGCQVEEFSKVIVLLFRKSCFNLPKMGNVLTDSYQYFWNHRKVYSRPWIKLKQLHTLLTKYIYACHCNFFQKLLMINNGFFLDEDPLIKNFSTNWISTANSRCRSPYL